MKKIPQLTKKRRSLADLSPDSLAAALYHRELAVLQTEIQDKSSTITKNKVRDNTNSDSGKL